MSNHSLWHRDKSLLLNYTQHAILTLFRVAVKTTNGHNITTKVLRQKITRGDTYSMSKLYDSLDYSATVYTQTFLSLKLTMFQQIKRNNSRKRFLFMQAISQYQWMTSSFFSISHCVMDSLWLMQIGYLKEKEKKKCLLTTNKHLTLTIVLLISYTDCFSCVCWDHCSLCQYSLSCRMTLNMRRVEHTWEWGLATSQ